MQVSTRATIKNMLKMENYSLSMLVMLMALLCLSACARYHTAKSPSGIPALHELSVGDTVEIVTADVKEYHFKVVDITETSLVGNNVEVPFEQIRILEVRRIGRPKVRGEDAGWIVYYISQIGLVLVSGAAVPM
jgi:hypothetical protein